MYSLSNYTTAWNSAKGKRSDKRIPPAQVGLMYRLGGADSRLLSTEHTSWFLYLTYTTN